MDAGDPIQVNRAPVLTLWAAVVAERLGHPRDTALTLGRAVAGSAARVKARNIGREERRADRDADTQRLAEVHVTAPVLLLGKSIRLLPTEEGELRAADGDQPAIQQPSNAIFRKRSAVGCQRSGRQWRCLRRRCPRRN